MSDLADNPIDTAASLAKAPIIRAPAHGDGLGYRDAFDAVARERRHLGLLQGPSLNDAIKAVREAIEHRHPFAFCVDQGRVVGWCSAIPYDFEGFGHAAPLHMGVLPEYRGKGLGGALLREVLAQARAVGMLRIELEAFSGNAAAIALYESHGFIHEGVKPKLRFLDGAYDDVVCMGILLQ